VFQADEYLEAAERAADFVLTQLQDGDRLLRSYRNGKAALNAYQEDYAYLSLALLDLYSATGEERWRDEGLRLLNLMTARFWDSEGGGYFFTSHDHETLITRTKSFQDGATPSGNSAAAQALIRAARITGEAGYKEQASALLSMAAPMMSEFAAAETNMLVAADEFLQQWKEGVRVPGADSVKLEGLISRSSVEPGGKFWVCVRVAIADGFHINSWHPTHDYLIPTRLLVDTPEGWQAGKESYPPAREYASPAEPEPLLIYEGTVLIGVELQVPPGAQPGSYPLHCIMRLQPCNDQQCFPPLEARMRFAIPITSQGGPEQHAEVFDALREQAG
jgi:DsbC/DsbD-like thiol-disulfide interchange protein